MSQVKQDENGNEVLKELKYEILNDFVPRVECVELVKPGDIVVSKADSQMDEVNGRGKVRESFADKHIVIKTNLCDILHHGAYTSKEAKTLGLVDGTCSYADIYKKIMPNLLQLDKKQISYLYFHRYYQRIYKAKLCKGIPCIPNPLNPPRSIWQYIKNSPAKIAYIGATNGAIIDGESTSDKIGAITVWYVLFSCHSVTKLLAQFKLKNFKFNVNITLFLHFDQRNEITTRILFLFD